jgi:hypothetical protein
MEVYAFGYRTEILEKGICEHPDNGIFIGEYRTEEGPPYVSATILLLKSVDDGATWATAQSWPYAWPTSTAGSIRHIHLVQYDPFEDIIWLGTGDNNDQMYLWTTTDGTVLTEISTDQLQEWRTTCLIFDRSYVYMPTDSASKPSPMYKIRRTDRVKSLVGYMSSLSMYSTMLSNGQILVFSIPQTLYCDDNYIHGYIVNFDNVKEIVRLQSCVVVQPGGIEALYVDGDYLYARVAGAYPATSNSFVFVRFEVREIRPVEIIKAGV